MGFIFFKSMLTCIVVAIEIQCGSIFFNTRFCIVLVAEASGLDDGRGVR